MSSEHPPNSQLKKNLNNNKFVPFSIEKNSQTKQSFLPEGAKKIGNYILGKIIGQGTFGKVYLGMHVLTGQKVAVKIIQKQKIYGKDINRVKNQIQILSTTRHNNLVHLYEIIQTEKSLLLVTQYLPNGELFNKILKQKKLEQESACNIFHQIIDGVQYLHKMNITHRDLKPQNIMIDYDTQIKIIDFGLSRHYNKNQKLSTPCGSPCYAAPQVIQCKISYDPELIDVWSCGVILYTMIGGVLPFVDSDKVKLYKKILSGVHKPLKNISNGLKDLLQKMLTVNPKMRMNIQQIKNHQWWGIVPYKKSHGLFRQQKIFHDEQILNKLLTFGFQKNSLIESVQNDLRNKQYGAYYILMKKIVKSGIKIPKYIGDYNFDITNIIDNFPLFHQQVTQTTSNMPICMTDNDIVAKKIESPSCSTSCTCTENIKPHQQWVFIGSKQYKQSQMGNFQTIQILPSNNTYKKNQSYKSLSRNKLLYKDNNFQKKKDPSIMVKNQFYLNNSQLNKATTNLYLQIYQDKVPANNIFKSIKKSKFIYWLQSNKPKNFNNSSLIQHSICHLPSIYIRQQCKKNCQKLKKNASRVY